MLCISRRRSFRLAWLILLVTTAAEAQRKPAAGPPPGRTVFVDRAGVIRWKDTGAEVALFGANYAIASSSDYRAAGYLTDDRKKIIDDDLAHFARMGWDGLRLAFWGDWQNADRAGNLIVNDHLDLLDYLIAKARERGISILFNPIHTYNAGWPDALQDSFPGFAAHVPKDRLGVDSAAIAAQVNYLRQILEHRNPYTGTALKDEPAILFIEMINEPIHHPEDLDGSVRYINALVDAVRSTGSKAILFHNLSQDFRIAPAIRRSKVQGASFGWYPTGLNSGHQLIGNYLRTVDDYPGLATAEVAGLPRLVYEFDSADQLTGYMYPAMARVFRTGGVQLAAMFAYDMLATASRNLGWQTHHLNLVYTPRKAISAVIAAEAMRRLPRGASYGSYPDNTSFGPFRVSYPDDRSEMVTADAYLNAGPTRTAPPDPAALARVAGYGSSAVVDYPGEGAYFLDRIRPGVWRLEIYPDAVAVEDPFNQPQRDKIVTRAIHRSWPMTIRLPDLGPSFSIEPIAAGNSSADRAASGRVIVRPGVYVLGAAGPVDRATLPARLGAIGLTEFPVAAPDPLPLRVVVRAAPQYLVGQSVEISARVVADQAPDSVFLWIRRTGLGWFRRFPMVPIAGYDYRATIPADSLAAGPQEFLVSVRSNGETSTFPGGISKHPWSWDFQAASWWRTMVVRPEVPLVLLSAGEDARRLDFTRIGDAIRQGIFGVIPSSRSGAPALHLTLPVGVGGLSPDDYTASLVLADRIGARGPSIRAAQAVRVMVRAIGPNPRLHLTLMEQDGTSWTTSIVPNSTWTEHTIPLAEFRIGRGVKLPLGYPGTWNNWVEPAAHRGGPGDTLRLDQIERLQLSLRREPGIEPAPDRYGVEVESVVLLFEAAAPN